LGIEYDGAGDFTSTPDDNVFSPFVNDLTIIIWVKTSTGGTANNSWIASKGNSLNFEWGINHDTTNEAPRFVLWQFDGADHGSIQSTTAINDGVWHYLALKIDYLTLLTVFTDNNKLTNSSFTNVMINGTADVRSGERQDQSTGYTGISAYFTIINTLVPDTQLEALQRGVNPFALGLSPNLKLFAPWYKSDTPDLSPDRRTITETNTITAVDNPPVQLISRYFRRRG